MIIKKYDCVNFIITLFTYTHNLYIYTYIYEYICTYIDSYIHIYNIYKYIQIINSEKIRWLENKFVKFYAILMIDLIVMTVYYTHLAIACYPLYFYIYLKLMYYYSTTSLLIFKLAM